MPRLDQVLAVRRSGAVTAAGILLMVALLLGRGVATDWVATWKILNIPAWRPPFLDLHHVTDVLPCAARGVDVYRDPSCDVLGRPFNYPPAWLWLGRIGLDGRDTVALALGIAAAALGVFVLLMRGRPISSGLLALLALVSPSVGVGFERGNIDLLVFSLTGCAALALGWAPRRGAPIAAALLFAGVVLKLYPLAAAASAARDRRWAMATGLLMLGSLLYLVSIRAYIPLIRANTFQIAGAYGAAALFSAPYGDRLADLLPPGLGVPAMQAVALAVAGMAGVAAFRWRRGLARFCRPADDDASAAFQFGAAIYCLTFLLGANLAYRLVFLLLLLPRLFDWIETGTGRTRDVALALMSASFAALWLTIGNLWEELLSQLVHWILFAQLAFILWLDLIFKGPALVRDVPGLSRQRSD
jgi:hypothetical protein